MALSLATRALASAALLLGCSKDAAKDTSPGPAVTQADEGDGKTPKEEAPASRIKVGDKAPDFSLVDQRGQTVTLADLTKDGNVAVVFYRSAVW